MGNDQEKEKTDKEKMIKEKAQDAKVVRKIVFITLMSFIVIIAIGIVSGYFYIKSAVGPQDPNSDETVEVEIPLGSSTNDIGQILEENGLIKNSTVFEFYVKSRNHSDFQAGKYELAKTQTLEEIIAELQSGILMEEPLFRITIPEGKTVEQIAAIFANQLSFSEEEFLDVVNDQDIIKELMDKYPQLLTDEILQDDLYVPLEGYLFAGTYDIFEEEPSPESIIEMMVDRTNTLIESKMELIDETDFSIHEVLTLASVIERESKFSEDRPKVAQVYLNRLDQDMKLQSDITAFYGIEHKAVVTYDDIKIETPYNTYVIDGLPVGPINSPSEESIDAVLIPEGEEFTKLYYFSRPNGETFYSDTLDEHNQIREQYRHEWYELENEASDS